MVLKTIDYENFNHYKKPSMVLGFPKCSFKCDKEYGKQVCQNSTLATSLNLDVSKEYIYWHYQHNAITKAIVLAGLEPFDSFLDLFSFIWFIRKIKGCNDDIVIYSGYKETELKVLSCLKESFTNIIVKFGRYKPNQRPHFDKVLGVKLASDNQYAKKIC